MYFLFVIYLIRVYIFLFISKHIWINVLPISIILSIDEINLELKERLKLMFEKYMEKDLIRKIKIINLLWESPKPWLTSIELAEHLGVTKPTIKSDVKFINIYCNVEDSFLINSNSNGYCILHKEKKNKPDCLKKIYKNSLFIRACCYFLKTNFSKVTHFANQEFISKSKAYCLKDKVIMYLKEIEVITATNEIDECRLRFLLAFFQIKLDEEFISISINNQAFFSQLFKEVEQIECCLLSDYSKKYASILFQLHFNRRKKNELHFEKKAVSFFQKTKIYERLSQPISLFLKKELYGQAKDEEIFYFVLIFNIMNANYFEEGDSLEIYQSYVKLISDSQFLSYKNLVDLFEKEFCINIKKDKLFEAALITFLRKCIFNLQILIPEEHFELGNIAEVPNHIFLRSRDIFYQWDKLIQLNFNYSDNHIKYFASKIYFLLSKKKRPQNIYLLTSFYTDYLLAKEILNKEYGNIVCIEQYNPNKPVSTYAVNDLVLYDTKYEILAKLPCLKLKISYVFDLVELQLIREQLFGYDLKGIMCYKYTH